MSFFTIRLQTQVSSSNGKRVHMFVLAHTS